MNIEDRFIVNSLIEEITDNQKAFFCAASARRLIELIPIQKRRWLSLSYEGAHTFKNSEGYSPGVGNVFVDGDKEKIEYTLNQGAFTRVGGYKITHAPGSIDIALMWGNTREDESGMSCRLAYNKASKEPVELKLLQHRRYVVPVLGTVGLLGFIPWKKPSYE